MSTPETPREPIQYVSIVTSGGRVIPRPSQTYAEYARLSEANQLTGAARRAEVRERFRRAGHGRIGVWVLTRSALLRGVYLSGPALTRVGRAW